MTTITKSIVINANRNIIRKYYADPTKWSNVVTEWQPDEAWPKAGATSRMNIKSGGLHVKGTGTMLAYDEATMAHHWRHDNEHNMPPFESWYTFDEADGKTTVTAKVEYTVPGSFLGKALDKLFVERQNAKDIEQGLLNLKALAEADPD